MSGSVLYRNNRKDVLLVDIPTSIAIAQGRPNDVLLSSAPQEEPFPAQNEPKSDKARQNNAGQYSLPTGVHCYNRLFHISIHWIFLYTFYQLL